MLLLQPDIVCYPSLQLLILKRNVKMRSFMLYFVTRLLSFFLLITGCLSVPVQKIAQLKLSAGDVNSCYDYIVVGGGTLGLTVADRLSEDGTSSNIFPYFSQLHSQKSLIKNDVGKKIDLMTSLVFLVRNCFGC